MNKIGKILVVLNFVFACVVGVILVFNIAFRAQWKEKFDSLERQAKVLEQNLKSTMTAQGSVFVDIRDKDLEIEKLKQQPRDTEIAKKDFEDAKLAELEVLNNKFKDKDLVAQEALKTQERMVQEIAGLNKTIKDREVFITTLQVDIKSALNSARNSAK